MGCIVERRHSVMGSKHLHVQSEVTSTWQVQSEAVVLVQLDHAGIGVPSTVSHEQLSQVRCTADSLVQQCLGQSLSLEAAMAIYSANIGAVQQCMLELGLDTCLSEDGTMSGKAHGPNMHMRASCQARTATVWLNHSRTHS